MARISAGVAISVVALAPLPFGSVDNRWVAIWAALMSVSLFTAEIGDLTKAQRLAVFASLTWLLLLVLLVAWSVWPNPPAGGVNPEWRRASDLLEQVEMPRISATTSRPWAALGAPALFCITYVRFVLLASRPGLRNVLFRTIAYSGCIYALYGLGALWLAPRDLLGQPKIAYLDDLTATFINRNTAACYFGSITIVWLLILCTRWNSLSRRTGADWLNAQWIAPLCGLALCCSAMLLTRSRAACLLTAGCSAMVGVWFATRAVYARTVVIVGALIVPSLLLIFGEGLLNRIGAIGLSDRFRLLSYGSTLHIVADYPVTGIGLGNFAVVFPAYRSAELGASGIWDRAHNTLLELAAETGLPFSILTICLWVALSLALVLPGLNGRRQPVAVLLAIGVGLLGLLHSLIDFSLQIPGYATVYAALVGCGFGAAIEGRIARTSANNVSNPPGSPVPNKTAG